MNAIRLLRETGRKVIETRKAAMARGEQVPEDILQRIIRQEGQFFVLPSTIFSANTQ